MLKQVEIAEIFSKSKAYLSGHFLLSSGLHSPNYFQCAQVLQYPQYASLLCSDLGRRFVNSKIDAVVSPAMGGVIVGHEVGRELKKRAIFTERENNIMTFRRGFTVEKGETVLVVEDVLTTGKSIKEVLAVLSEYDCTVAGIGVIVDRSGGKVQFNYPLESLMQMEVITHQPDSCPLCKQNIPLVKPGSRKIEQ